MSTKIIRLMAALSDLKSRAFRLLKSTRNKMLTVIFG